jgi:hypothetical protein
MQEKGGRGSSWGSPCTLRLKDSGHLPFSADSASLHGRMSPQPLLILLVAVALFVLPACQPDDGQVFHYPPQLLEFTAAKRQQVHELAKDLNIRVPREVTDFFEAAARGDCATVTNSIARLGPEYSSAYSKAAADQPAWVPFWQPMLEVEGALTAFASCGTKYSLALGNGIIQSIPAGSIYFGGNDDCFNLVVALSESHSEGRPIHTMSQNALCSDRYMDYLRRIHGKQIHLPTSNEVQKVIEDYKADALLRLKHDEASPTGPRQVMPGEDIRLVNGEVQIRSYVALMGMNARVAKLIVEQNPKPDVYLKEGFPLDWTSPYLSPHGFIFKLHHERLNALTSEMLDADHAFWSAQCQVMLGGSPKPDTSLSIVCQFVEAVYGRKDWSGFSGDHAYVTNESAMMAFGSLRGSIAGLYQWRLTHKTEADDVTRLRAEADYAFRQAFALCPTNLAVTFRYLSFLQEEGRPNDAIALISTALKLAPDNLPLKASLAQMRKDQGQPEGPDRKSVVNGK